MHSHINNQHRHSHKHINFNLPTYASIPIYKRSKSCRSIEYWDHKDTGIPFLSCLSFTGKHSLFNLYNTSSQHCSTSFRNTGLRVPLTFERKRTGIMVSHKRMQQLEAKEKRGKKEKQPLQLWFKIPNLTLKQIRSIYTITRL